MSPSHNASDPGEIDRLITPGSEREGNARRESGVCTLLMHGLPFIGSPIVSPALQGWMDQRLSLGNSTARQTTDSWSVSLITY